jgi:transcriptional regulator with XRE-family HTH domain
MNDALSTYGEIVEVIANLPIIVRERRRADGLSMRAAAAVIGCSPSTVVRCEQGKGADADTVVALLKWLDRTPHDQTPPELETPR